MHTVGAHLRVPYGEDDGAEREVVERLSSYVLSLPDRPRRRAGNVSSVQLLQGDRVDGWSSFLVMAETDSFAAGLEEGLVESLPQGSQVMMLGELSVIGPSPAGDTEG